MNVHHYEYQSEFARKYYEEGRKEGLEAGRREGRQEALARLLNLRFGKLPDWTLERLQAMDDTDFARWTVRALTGMTLDAVFAGDPSLRGAQGSGK